MEQLAQIQSHGRLVRLSRILLTIVLCTAMLVLIGWMFDVPVLRQFFPGFGTMNPLTAVCFVFVSGAFYIVPADGKSAFKTVVSNLMALLVITVTASKLFDFSFGSSSSVDTWLFHDKVKRELFNGEQNGMASSTAVCLIMASITILLRNLKNKVGYALFQIVSLLMLLAGVLSILGYMYGSGVFYGVFRYMPMALFTSICFVILGLSFLFRYPQYGFMQEISNPLTGGFSARFLIPFAFLVPALLGFIRMQVVRAGVISNEFGVAAYVLSIILCLLFVIWYVALIINRKDKLRLQAEKDLAKSKMALEELNKKLEKDVQEKTIQIRDIFERVSDVFYAVNMEDRFTFVNNRAAKVFGFESEEMIGKPIWDFFSREAVSDQFRLSFEAAKTLQQPQTMEGFSELAGHWFLVNMYPSPGGVSFILQDITERKEAEDQLIKEKKFSDSVIKSLPGIFYYYDENRKLLNWNKNFETVSGYTGEEISGMTWDQFFADDEIEYISSRIDRVFTKGYTDAEANILSRDGTKTPYYFSGILSEYEGKPCLIGVGFDITKRTKAEQALKLSENKYRILFEWNPIPMWMLSLPDLKFIDVNNAAIRHYGYSREEFLSMTTKDIRTPEEAERLNAENKKEYPEVTNVGLWKHLKKNKESIIAEAIIHNIEIGGKQVRLVLANDVTEKIKAKEALEKSNE
ncbi:MAG: PAS domain S-box protein, partial [Chitinophagaceae bacterium]|nr:PAS domain S-box protein [Chitinophagaceae bacterium]